MMVDRLLNYTPDGK